MKYDRRSLIFTSMAHFANDGNFFLFPVLIPFYSSLPGVSLVGLGSVAIIYNVLSGLLSTPIGAIADRIDRDAFLIFSGMFLNASSVVLFALPFLYPRLLYVFVISGSVVLGFAQSFYHPIGAAIISIANPGEESSSVMGVNSAFGSLGRAMTPYVISFAILLIGGFDGLTSFSLYLFLIAAVTFAGLRTFSRRNSGRKVAGKADGRAAGEFHSYAGFIYLLTAIVFIRSMFMLAVTTYIPEYMSDIYQSKHIMSIVLTAGLLIAVPGGPLFGRITSLKGGKFTIILTSALSALFFAVFLLTRSVLVSGLAYAVFAATAFTGFPVLLGYVGNVVPNRYSATSNALVWGIGNTLGGAAGIAVLTLMLLIMPLSYSLWLMLLFAVVSLAMTPFLPGRKDAEADSVTE
ncbi:MAG: MFS transporter [Thermoplasmata archaeon YP2-bin.285]|uniref:MFS transporter n=1 Tax=Candidatus Sysuiplasma superficiale TaxID=2823368 RepID=A0A8J7YQT0_9ARCH|nr:MFS transporter [Candidatus Sysuiplasma superficiale]